MNALHSGFVDLVLAQRPTEIGRRALRLAVDHLNGRSVPGTVHVGVDLITSESLDDIDPAEVTY
jgi:ABC-type sugar transport system substrate-binding protein